jgi:hypothetical protein
MHAIWRRLLLHPSICFEDVAFKHRDKCTLLTFILINAVSGTIVAVLQAGCPSFDSRQAEECYRDLGGSPVSPC